MLLVVGKMTYTNVFILLLLSWVIARFYLNHRQISHVMQHRETVPLAFREKISLADHQKAADYTAVKGKFGYIALVIEIGLLLLWTLLGGLEWLSNTVSTFSNSPILHGLALVALLIVISSIVQLPLSWWNTFKIEQSFGFNATTLSTFISDRLKGLVLFTLLGLPILAALFWLLDKSGERWWLYGWICWTAFGFFVSWIYPTLIAPFFNKFTPLDDPELQAKITKLLSDCGFESNGIYVMDGSRRSAHGNAYFTGLGKNKRIVFYDTLLETLTHEQIVAVLAHELGHFKHKHIMKGMLVNTLLTLLGFYLVSVFIKSNIPSAIGVHVTDQTTLLVLFVLVSPLLSYYMQPLFSWWSRKNEFEADAFAKVKSSGQDLENALIKMYQDNASSLTPDPWYSRFYYSHPPAHERISQLKI